MTWRHASGTVLFVALALLPFAGSAIGLAVQVDQEGAVAEVARAAAPPAPLAFDVAIQVDDDAEVYVKVAATTSNPAYRNGTVNASGWWSEFAVSTEGERRATGATNGTEVVELGTLDAAADHTLHVLVTVPSEAVTGIAEYRLTYVVATRSSGGNDSNGASIDPSKAFSVSVHVVEPTPAAADDESSVRRIPGFAFGAAVASLAVVTARFRRRRPGREDGV